MFFPTYILCQPIATILFRKIGALYFLSAVTFLWGIVMVNNGIISGFGCS